MATRGNSLHQLLGHWGREFEKNQQQFYYHSHPTGPRNLQNLQFFISFFTQSMERTVQRVATISHRHVLFTSMFSQHKCLTPKDMAQVAIASIVITQSFGAGLPQTDMQPWYIQGKFLRGGRKSCFKTQTLCLLSKLASYCSEGRPFCRMRHFNILNQLRHTWNTGSHTFNGQGTDKVPQVAV